MDLGLDSWFFEIFIDYSIVLRLVSLLSWNIKPVLFQVFFIRLIALRDAFRGLASLA